MKVSDFHLLEDEEEQAIIHQVVHEFNQTQTEYPKESTIQELFIEVVPPNALAVVADEQSLLTANSTHSPIAWRIFSSHKGSAANSHRCHARPIGGDDCRVVRHPESRRLLSAARLDAAGKSRPLFPDRGALSVCDLGKESHPHTPQTAVRMP